jgi:hypothetical protein
MSITRSIRDFVKTCPLLPDEYDGLGVDFMAEGPVAFMIEAVPEETILKKYINGDSVRQFTFAFCSQESYGSDVWQNLENADFYEDFAAWLEHSTWDRNLPELDSGKEAESIEATTQGYVYSEDMTVAQYRIQCRLKYLQKG